MAVGLGVLLQFSGGTLGQATAHVASGAAGMPQTPASGGLSLPTPTGPAILTDYQLRLNPDGGSATLRWCVSDARVSGVMLVFGYREEGVDTPQYGYKSFQDRSAAPGTSRCIEEQVTWDNTVPTGYVRIAGTTSAQVVGFGDFPAKNEYGYLGRWFRDRDDPRKPPFFIGNTCTSPTAVGSCDLPFDMGQRFWVGPVLPPSAPQVPRVEAVGGSTLTWYEPESLGGDSSVSYTVEVKSGGQDWRRVGTTLSTSYDLASLPAGRSSARVAALNSAGQGTWSDEVDVVLVSAPSPPIIRSVVPGDAQVTVSWQAPASDGGSSVTGYTVTASPGAQTCSTTRALTCVVSGLTNGNEYTFSVTATNAAGTSVPSAASAPVVPKVAILKPGAVTALKASPQRGALRITWAAPADLGGAPSVTYRYRVGKGTWIPITRTSVRVPGVKGKVLTVAVQALNEAGQGPSLTVRGVPR